MNEFTLIQLKIIVERVVRPVRASMRRKRKMREELLAHVTAVFAEESAKSGDERAALEQTEQRFGKPAQLANELQQSVPASDAISRFWDGRPDESTLRGALRLACVFEAFILVICGITLVLTGWVSAWSGEDLLAVMSRLDFVPQWSFGPLWLVGIALVTHWIEKSLHGPEPLTGWPRIGWKKSFTSAWAIPAVRVALIVGGLSFFLLLCIRGANWPTEPAQWDHGILIVAGILLAGDLAATSVFCAWVLVQSADERRRYHEEWARLPIDPERGAPA